MTAPRPPLPVDALEARQHAETNARTADSDAPARAVAWALLAIAGELAEIRRELQRRPKGGR
jgi:hypothetical protein